MVESEEVEQILDESRNGISQYCIDECHSYCCRKGYLVLSPEEMEVTMQDQKEKYLKKSLLKLMPDGNWSLFMGDKDYSCPSLKGNMCMIHKNPLRSDTCRVFPISIVDGVINQSRRCPARWNRKLYPYVAQLVNMGFKLKKE